MTASSYLFPALMNVTRQRELAHVAPSVRASSIQAGVSKALVLYQDKPELIHPSSISTLDPGP